VFEHSKSDEASWKCQPVRRLKSLSTNSRLGDRLKDSMPPRSSAIPRKVW
jgi:hypothetical protein